MARRSVRDNTNVYRFRTTHRGVYLTAEEYRSGKPGSYTGRIDLQGQPFEEVRLHGLYNSRIAFHGWVPSYGTFKLERQKLEAVIVKESGMLRPVLEWQTIETKQYEQGEQQ